MSTPPELPPEPFYLPLGAPDSGRFHATRSTTGPWFADAQHVGPPSALLVRALERLAGGAPGAAGAGPPQLARVAVEVLGPVPAGPVEVTARVERPGRAIELLAAELAAGGRAVARARAWRIAAGDTTAVTTGAVAPLPPPEAGRERPERPPGMLPGFLDALEWRWLQGWIGEPGPGMVWARLRVPLVEDEEPTPLQRLAVVADCTNGAAAPLDPREWLFVNTDLTIHLHRPPVGEWIATSGSTAVGPTGLGTAAGLLFDADGQVGRSAQALVVRRR